MTANFEARLAGLLNEQSTQRQPPARVSVSAAIRRGNSRLRWRRGGLAAAPALAASAVIAIALTGPVPFGGHPAAQKSGTEPQAAASGRPVSPAVQPAQTGSLPMLRTDASFGWLPAGDQFRSGSANATMADMGIFANGEYGWDLTIWAPGACVLLSNGDQKEEVYCKPGGNAPWTYRVGSSAASIRGHEAFWVDIPGHFQGIIWEYQASAWAMLQTTNLDRQPAATLLRIARGISFGPASGQPIRYDLQFPDAPSGWRVSQVGYRVLDGALLANSADLTDHLRAAASFINMGKGGYGNNAHCWSSPAKHSVLRGYDVETMTSSPAEVGGSGSYQLCAPDAHGISLWITTPQDSERTPTELFEHMRWLGTNPADWATSPLG